MMFGLGGAARGYSFGGTYVSASLYNVLNDWFSDPHKNLEGLFDAAFSPDGKGAIPGYVIAYTRAFYSKPLFCEIVNSLRPIGYNDTADQANLCAACGQSLKPGQLIHNGPDPATLNRWSDNASTIDRLKNLMPLGY